MIAPVRIAVVGLGKIARDQHLPTIERSASFDLVATVSRQPVGEVGVPHFTSVEALAASGVGVDAVALCTPPQVRRRMAQDAIDRGWHVFLEKPPGTTLAEVAALCEAAAARRVSLFASWHSRFADGVEHARSWLNGRDILRASIVWREDVRVWHPGQDWIWEPGGFGVFDPGINALSIATAIMPRPFFVETADLDVPANRAAPIAARMRFEDVAGIAISMDLDFRQEGPQTWDIVVETDQGTLRLERGGAVLSLPGGELPPPVQALHGEYAGLYDRFAAVIRDGVLDVDVRPLQLVADAFLKATHHRVDAFHW